MKKVRFYEDPELVVNEGINVRINFDKEEVTDLYSQDEEPMERQAWDCYVVRVNHPVTRDRVIDAIITAEYPNDKMQAIINNHLLEEDATHEEEFTAMQAWRAHAKEVATSVIDFLNPSVNEEVEQEETTEEQSEEE